MKSRRVVIPGGSGFGRLPLVPRTPSSRSPDGAPTRDASVMRVSRSSTDLAAVVRGALVDDQLRTDAAARTDVGGKR